MTAYELASLVLSGLALLVAGVALSRASAATQARQQLENFIKAEQQTDLQVLFLKSSAERYNFTLSNRGSSTARNVNLEILDEMPVDAHPLAESQSQLPAKQLDPGGFFQISAQVGPDTPTHFTVRLTWNNADGSESVKELPVNLID